MTDYEKIALHLALSPEIGEELARIREAAFRKGYSHAVAHLGTDEQAEEAAAWCRSENHGSGAERYSFATNPPFAGGPDWVQRSADLSEGALGRASFFLDELLEEANRRRTSVQKQIPVVKQTSEPEGEDWDEGPHPFVVDTPDFFPEDIP